MYSCHVILISLEPAVHWQCTYNAERVIGNGTFGIVYLSDPFPREEAKLRSFKLQGRGGTTPTTLTTRATVTRYSAHIVETNETVAIKKA